MTSNSGQTGNASNYLAEFRDTCGECAKLMAPEVLSTVFLMCRYPSWETRYKEAARDEMALMSNEVSSIAIAGQAHVRPATWHEVLQHKMQNCSLQKLESAFHDNRTLSEFRSELCRGDGNHSTPDDRSDRDKARPLAAKNLPFVTRLYFAIYMPPDYRKYMYKVATEFGLNELSEPNKEGVRNFLRQNSRVDLDAIVELIKTTIP